LFKAKLAVDRRDACDSASSVFGNGLRVAMLCDVSSSVDLISDAAQVRVSPRCDAGLFRSLRALPLLREGKTALAASQSVLDAESEKRRV
jgi:hypothetical protein